MRLAVLSVLLVVSACATPVAPIDEGPILVGPEGGRFVRPCAAIDVPPGAVSGQTRIDVTALGGGIPELSGRKPLGQACRLGPSTLELLAPIVVTLPYPPNELPAGVSTDAIAMSQQVAQSAPVTLTSRIDTSIAVVSASVQHPGTLWLSAPRDPLLEGFGVSPAELVMRVGDSLPLTVTTVGVGGDDTTEVPISFAIAPARVANVTAAGVVTALAPGMATVTVRASKLSREVTVRVRGDTRGPVSFVHDTPFPTGNDLHAAAFGPDGSLWVAGDNTTILSRDPAGRWSRRFSAPGATLRAIALDAAGHLVAVGASGTEGILVTQAPAATEPTVTRLATALPQALWFDGTYGMAVGRGDDVLVLHDGEWIAEDSPSFETLLAVIGDGEGGFVTLGNQGSLYAYDPVTRTWDSLYQTRLATRLTAGLVVDADGSAAWAAGGGQLWRFDGSGWIAGPLAPSQELDTQDALALVDGELMLAGGREGSGQLLRRAASGGAWSVQPVRGPQQLRAFAGDGAGGVVAVGTLGAVWSLSGASFVEQSRGFHADVVDVAAAPDGTVIAAVNDGWQGQIMRRIGDEGRWEPLLPPLLAAEHGRVHAVLARSATDLWAATDLGVLRFSDGAWGSGTVTPLFEPIHQLTGCGDAVIAVGARGTFLIGTGPIDFAAAETTRDLHAVACSGTSTLWFAGDEVLLENGLDRTDGRLSRAPWRAVYSPAPGEAWAFGQASYAVFWDTQRLRGVNAPGGLVPDVVHDVWGSAPDNVYAVGRTSLPDRSGFVLRFDGGSWERIDGGSAREVTSASGWSSNDLWIGTRGGGVLRAVER